MRETGPSQGAAQNRRAAAALEFGIVIIPFLMLLFAIVDAGLDGVYQLAFDEAVRNAARQIRIDGQAGGSGGAFATAVCAEFGVLAINCPTGLTYNVQAAAPTAGFVTLTPVTLSATGTYPGGFYTTAQHSQNANVLVQVAYKLPFPIPFFSSLITGTGTPSILTATIVRIEPY